jgi:hypothetical protein
MRKEKQATPSKSRLGGAFKDMRIHSDDIRSFRVDSEPSFRMLADTESPNKADRDLKKLIEDNVMPARRNAGLKPQVNRRYK